MPEDSTNYIVVPFVSPQVENDNGNEEQPVDLVSNNINEQQSLATHVAPPSQSQHHMIPWSKVGVTSQIQGMQFSFRCLLLLSRVLHTYSINIKCI